MTRLITSGAELNDLAGAGSGGVFTDFHPDPFQSGGSTPATISSLDPRSGTYHWRLASANACYIYTKQTTVTAVTYYLRWYQRFSLIPDGNITLLALRDATDTSGIISPIVFNASTGVIELASSPTNGLAVNAREWIRIEYSWMIDTGTPANNTGEARINGTVLTGSAAPGGSTLVGIIRVGHAVFAATNGMFSDIDDFAMNNSSGSNPISYPGSAKIVMLAPVSDADVGAGWTLGTGTAIAANSFDAVNNKPPTGVADLTAGSDSKQIRNAAANANSNFDVKLQTYASVGIKTVDTITILAPFVATSAPVVTSAKQGTFGLASNPTIALASLSAGGTAGAFWSGVAGGTHPAGWKFSFGTITTNPTVSILVNPVARVQQVTSSTRIAVVDSIGMMVEYTEGTDVPASTSYLEIETPQKPLSIKNDTVFVGSGLIYSTGRLAQTFTMAADGVIGSIDFYIEQNASTPPDSDLLVTLAIDSAGSVGATITTAIIPLASVAATFSWVSALLSANLTSGQKYWVILSYSGGGAYDWSQSGTDAIPGGDVYSDTGAGFVLVGPNDKNIRVNFSVVESGASFIPSFRRRPVPMIKGPSTDTIMGMNRRN